MKILRCIPSIFFLLLGLLACGGEHNPGSPNQPPPNFPNQPLPNPPDSPNQETPDTPIQKDDDVKELVPSTQQIIGTQAIGGAYQFDPKKNKVLEQAEKIQEMGSNIIKINLSNLGSVGTPTFDRNLDTLLRMEFDTFFFWWRSDGHIWKDGFENQAQRDAEYKATYDFVLTKLLNTKINPERKRTFYIGHWEGDWYLLPDYQTDIDPADIKIKGMINWLNVRQQAIEKARADADSTSNATVFHYTEVNRVRDAMYRGKKRLVNAVLPKTNVDYVSYSAYDVQHESAAEVKKTMEYIKSQLPVKAGISGSRVFIGEFGVPAIQTNFDGDKHEEINRKIAVKFLKSDAPYILYWQMYNNELEENGTQRGFWLIDHNNQKQPLHDTLAALYKKQKSFTDVPEQTIEWLEGLN